MIYAKHPTLGNRHFPDDKRAEIEAAGWVVWPRTKEQKAGKPAPVAAPAVTPDPASPRQPPEPVGAAPAKKVAGKK